MAQSHPGFKKVAYQISRKQGISIERARKILAYKSRHASPAAKRRNPRLNKVRYRGKK